MTLQTSRFKTRVSKEDYMVRDHLVHGVEILPGVFFLDMVYRMAARIGVPPASIELRRCLFTEAIAVTDEDDRQVQVSFEPRQGGGVVSVESRRMRGSAALDERWDHNFTCELHLTDAPPPARVALDRLKAASTRETDADELYAFARSVDIEHREFMKAAGRIYRGDGFLLADIHLGPLARSYLGDFHVHPVYLDFATLTPFCLLDFYGAPGAKTPFIPIYIDAFRAFAPLGERCHVLVEKKTTQGASADILSSDIHLLDEEGSCLVTVRKFSAKRIRSRDLITGLRAPRAESERPEGGARASKPPEGPAASTGSARELVEEALKGILAGPLQLSPEAIDAGKGFYEQGLTSADLLQIVRDLESRFGWEMYPTLLFEHATVTELAGYILEEMERRSLSLPSSVSRPAPPSLLVAEVVTEVRDAEPPASPGSGAGRRPPSGGVDDEIAIIGVAGRFPMARTLSELWENLRAGRDCITEVPLSRWDHRRYFDPERGKPGRTYSKWGGFIEGADEFDPLFFNISPREAEMMDPQERLFLEIAWETLEDAGYTRERLAAGKGNDVGVFAGVMWSDYQLFGLEEILRDNPVVAGSWFSSIANRVSYFFNFQGPSLPIDTACSSSLYAIHLACESLKRGECSAALAGGVNLSLHPSKYIKLSELQMLSSDGRCRAFGKGGDGYVPGEGVGAVLLKPLGAAIAAGDPIHAVIKATAVNHGGRTSGFSVPSPDAQARLIVAALEKARVSPETLGYIEAHGTGTSLGDPIEIAGLTSAFRRTTSKRGFCAVGAIKSNIGHLEAAAGMAGISKVLLCMKHKTLVPSLHAKELNPSIDFASTPFFVPQEAAPWERPAGSGAESRRRAAISSFGAGGANAHVILEEYDGAAAPDAGAPEGAAEIIVLSARNEERLRAQAGQLRDFLREGGGEAGLQDIAHTLLVGREAMEARLAVVARDTSGLCRALDDYLDHRESDIPTFTGHVKRGSPGTGRVPGPRGDLPRLAALWVEGAAVSWDEIAGSRRARRISLPTYPFARKRCWIQPSASAPPPPASRAPLADGARAPERPARLHPLLDANASTLRASQLTRRFRPDDSFLADHLVRSRPVLPAAVYLEMARAAGALVGEAAIDAIEQVVWASPLWVEGSPVDTTVRIEPQGDRLAFEIHSGAGDQATLHARGKLVPSRRASASASAEAREASPIDIEAIQRRCPSSKGAEDVYATLAARGLRYGPRMRPIRALFTGPSEVLAALELPEPLSPGDDAYVLHPALLDGALQTVVGLIGGEGEGDSGDLLLPHTVDEVRILGVATRRCHVHAVRAADPGGASGRRHRFDLDLLDEAGRPFAVLRGFALGTQKGRAQAAPDALKGARDGLIFYEPAWERAPLPASAQAAEGARGECLLLLHAGGTQADTALRHAQASVGDGREVVLVEPGDGYHVIARNRARIRPARDEDIRSLVSTLNDQGLRIRGVLHLWNAAAPSPDYADAGGALPLVEEQLERGLHTVFALCRVLATLKGRERLSVVYAYPGSDERPHDAALGGLAKSIVLEAPKLAVKTVQLEGAPLSSQATWDLLLREVALPESAEVRHGAEGRRVRTFARVAREASSGGPPFVRDGGVYLLSGGAGALALLFARHLAQQAKVDFVLLGRSPLDDARRAALAEIEAIGAGVLYVQGDVTTAGDVRRAVASALERHGKLNGVIHAAGVLADAIAINKPIASFARVLAPKVRGTLNLDEATKELPLDFMILFSSASAVLGNVGQTDYAAGNRFMDSFAALREELCARGKRSGRTLSINWPLWREGGMKIPAGVEDLILRDSGLRVLDTDRGLLGFAAAESSGAAQIMILDGDPAAVERRIHLGRFVPVHPPAPVEAARAVAPARAASEESRDDLRAAQAWTEQRLTAFCSGLLKVPEGEIDPDTDFSDYGLDSLMAIKLVNQLEELCESSVDPSVVAEHPNVRALARFAVSMGTVRVGGGPAPRSPVAEERPAGPRAAGSGAPEPRSSTRSSPERAPRGVVHAVDSGAGPRRVAVVAMACRFPGSPTVEAFWDNLISSRHLTSPVPADRWDVAKHYSSDKDAPNKTYSRWGGFIDGVDRFDAGFFGIPEQDAVWMDPQQRIALEAAQDLLDRAGYRRDEVDGTRTGVFLGATANEYVKGRYAHQRSSTPHLLASTLQNMVAARISKLYNLKGPSIVVDSACSSSLVAIHQACRALLGGECELAIAGGVWLLLDPFTHIALSQARLLSDDGATRVFDRNASGFTLGEGVGMVLLKEHERALRDGDLIVGHILGSAVNNDGRTMGAVMPSKEAQVDVIEQALRESGVSAADIGYLETHGAGNTFGDPIEIHAASEVYRRATDRRQYCGVGSVKSNLGALLHAGGVASFVKVMLALQRKRLPATLHCDEPHARFQFEATPFYPVTRERAWEPLGDRRLAAVSAFGFGGTNCHMIVGEAGRDEDRDAFARRPLRPTRLERKRLWLEMPGALLQDVPTEAAPQEDAPTRQSAGAAPPEGGDAFALDALVSSLLSLESPPPRDRSFLELGASSSWLVALNARLEAQLGAALSPAILFDHPTLERLSAYLEREFPGRLAGAARPGGERPGAAPSAPAPAPAAGEQDDIAVIGMAGLFAGSPDLETFWMNLLETRQLVREVPSSRWEPALWYDADPSRPNKTSCKWGSFLDDVDAFDAPFFNVSPREAERMDPQLRLLLQVLYAAAEDAGRIRTLRGSRTGVFVGVCFRDYDTEMVRRGCAVGPHDGTGNAATMMANRPSFMFDLKGPSMAVDTACSSSLVALHTACRALRSDECEMAFVGGVNLILSPRHYLHFSAMKALSPTGRSRSFDAAADGYVPGEAVAAVLLKPLAKAVADGDPIHAVIKGSATGHSGRTASVTAPSAATQAELIARAWRDARIDPATITYLEAHGTGTRLGDPIEVEGLKMAFRPHAPPARSCALGSSKAHLGHTEAAAGITGVIKVILSMKHGMIPAMPTFQRLSPAIRLDASPLYINEGPIPWPRSAGAPRRAGVSSFGFGGAGAHVVIEERVREGATGETHGALVFPFSARDEGRLREVARRMLHFVARDQSASLPDIAHTLQVGREEMDARLAITAASRDELARALEAFLAARGDAPNLFTGSASAPGEAAGALASEGDGPAAVARRWVRGEQVAWPRATATGQRTTVSLPTYPFDKERYWLPEDAAEPPPAPALRPDAGEVEPPPTLSYFEPVWGRSPGVAPASAPLSRRGVLLIPDHGLDGGHLLSALRAASGALPPAVVAQPGAGFRAMGGGVFEVLPGRAADYEALLSAVAAQGLQIDSVVVLRAAGSRDRAPAKGALDEALGAELPALFELAKALIASPHVERARVLYVCAEEPEAALAHREAVAGFGRSFMSLDRRFTFQLVRVADAGDGAERLVERALTELRVADPLPPVEVRYDAAGERWTQRIAEVAPLGAGDGQAAAFQQGGVYLITGGVGGVGGLLAEHLAARCRARLVLLGRSPLGAATEARLDRLGALGADAVYLQADVTSPGDVNRCVAYAKARFSRLDGLIHAAGSLSEGSILQKGKAEIDRILSPKVRGTLVLDEATRDEPLELFVLLSSLSSLLGTATLPDYAAANRFLDGFARFRESLRSRGLRRGQTLAINYPYWKEGGMRMSAETEALIAGATGMSPLPTVEGLEALEGGLRLARSRGSAQVLVAFGDAARIKRTLGVAEGAPSATPAPARGGWDREIEGQLASDLSELAVSTLKLKKAVEPGADLGKLGFESITISEFAEAVSSRYGVAVSPAVFYEHPTLESYARHLLSRYPEQVRRRCGAGEAGAGATTPLPGPELNGTASGRAGEPSGALASPPPRSVARPASPGGSREIAIVGIAGVFPGSPDLRSFWENLEAERDLVTGVPEQRFSTEGIACPSGGFIADVERFDPLFFNLSPSEADLMDPQQRVLLEVVWHAIEDAGRSPRDLSRAQVGVFVGVSNVDYADVLAAAGKQAEAHVTTGLSTAMVANRISYVLGLTGPSESVDTGCSSSLVALHRAATAIQVGDCDAAIVAGVNLLLSARPFIACGKAGMLSADGRCKTFDRAANGYVRGEGAGAILMKPLSSALADGDPIHAILRGTGVNHGGRAQGLTVPNPSAQAELLSSVYRRAQVDPSTLGYIEAHGTGTPLGDPIEVNGLKKAFERAEGAGARSGGARCGLGTVKTSIGHLESAAGIAGLLKVVLALKHAKLPGNLHFDQLNPHIELEDTPFYIVHRTQPWEPLAGEHGAPLPRRAGVSSFGFGGVNAHAVLEEFPDREEPAAEPRGADLREIVVLSARSGERLQEVARRLSSYLDESEARRSGGAAAPRSAAGRAPCLRDIAYTLQVGRSEMEHRLAVVASSIEELRSGLRDFLAGSKNGRVVAGAAGQPSHAARVLGESEEGSGLVQALLEKGRALDVARLWVEGIAVPWSALQRPGGRRRISLPAYPFTRMRCWADPLPSSRGGAALAGQGSAEGASPLDPVTPRMAQYVASKPYDAREVSAALGRVNAVGHRLLLRALGAMGLWAEGREPPPRGSLQRELGILPAHRRLFDAAIAMLEREGLIEDRGGRLAMTPAGSSLASSAESQERLRRERPEVGPIVDLLTACVPALPDVLTGRKQAMDVLFPGGDKTLVERVYTGNLISDYYNDLVGHAVSVLVEQRLARTPGATVKVLEVGAGTGGTTRFVLDRLRPEGQRVSYHYTDVSAAFTRYGERSFQGALPDIVFRTLDVERDPAAQGFGEEAFDVVLATNVLHATKDVLSTLRALHTLLGPRGVLVINELTREQDFTTLTFGLTKGWWLFEDGARRLPHSPLLRFTQWRTALREAGFPLVRGFGAPRVSEEQLEQSVLLCERGAADPKGLVRAAPVLAAAQNGAAAGLLAAAAAPVPAPAPDAPGHAHPGARLQAYLIDLFAEMLRIPRDEIDVASTFERYGVDSMSSVELVKRLESHFGALSKTLLFECITIESLARHLLDGRPRECAALFQQADGGASIPRASSGEALPARRQEAPAGAIAVTGARPPEALAGAIAIIGLGGVFPGSPDPEALWRNLRDGNDLITTVPEDRFDWRAIFGDPGRDPGKTNTRWGGFIDGVDRFDPLFFNISPAEAELMDPQQRVFLQIVWKTLEDAGYRASELRGSRTGVFVGVSSFDYHEIIQRARRTHEPYSPSGLSHAVLANRISYLLDLRGPSEPVDTACSSSLVALHRAVRSLQAGDCDLAIAGGVNLLLTPELFVAFGQSGFMSSVGRCMAFDHRADGYVRGEGAGAVLLKPLARALDDRDCIHAVIRGVGVNHGGRVQSMTVPNPNAQADLIASVLARAGVEPETVSYVEAHGTGTSLGDPIEINGLKAAFAQLGKARSRPVETTATCGVGSVKSNIGHLEAAAGIAGLIKVVLAMRHRALPPSIHLERLNPFLQLDETPFYIVDRTVPWDRRIDPSGAVVPRRAGVSSFGFGGANAHVLLEEHIEPEIRGGSPLTAGEPREGEAIASRHEVIPLSAKSGDRLRAYVEELLEQLSREEAAGGGPSLADIAYTFQVGREPMPFRVAIVACSRPDLLRRCRGYLSGEPAGAHVATGELSLLRGGGGALEAHEGEASPEAEAPPRDEEACVRLARRWVAGGAVPWGSLYPPGTRRRVPMVTYPFARERCWAIEPEDSAPAPDPGVTNGPRRSNGARLEGWRELLLDLKEGRRSVDDVDRLLGFEGACETRSPA
ncbi:SDR family NAD(P)-dependent oxidoreductase [Sorangium sp. So ce590]|uniref:SDR family NAD(P)-dependent oxidoreductase n=1 Tax=Sorangium sp. So ce590 TaxID=3133317 RepID=UPI003F606147